jgi:hypothetical protein
MEQYGLDSSGSEYKPVEGSFEHGNEPLGSIKCWEVLEQLRNWRLFKKYSVPRSFVLVSCELHIV